MSSTGWKVLEDDHHSLDEVCNEAVDTQVVERKRRLISGSKTKTHRRYIQDIASFLWNEAIVAEEDLKFEQKEVAREYIVRATLGGETTEAKGKTVKSAKEAAAKAMLQQIGPFIEDIVWEKYTEEIRNTVTGQCKSWLPPVFDARHISMLNCGGIPFKGEVGSPFYEVEVQIGPITGISVTDNLNTSLSSLVKHMICFLSRRDLPNMIEQPMDESLAEMEVAPSLNQPYVQTQGLIEVRLEDQKENLVLPPVDVWVMQQHLPDGHFPPQYGTRDSWGCMKVFYCHRCMVKMNGTMTLVKHVRGMKHWRKIGKFFINGQLRVTFNPVGEPFTPKAPLNDETEEEKDERLRSTPKLCQNCLEENKREISVGHCTSCQEFLCTSCCEAHGKTRLTKAHHIEHIPAPLIKHPVQDQEKGVKVEKDSMKYLIAVYRCTTNKVGSAQRNRQEAEYDRLAASRQPFAPPAYGGSGDYGSMYDNGNGGRMGWEDPTVNMMGPGMGQFEMHQMGPMGGHFMGPYMCGAGPMRYGFSPRGGHGHVMGSRPRFPRGYSRGLQKPSLTREGCGPQSRKPNYQQSGEVIRPERPEDAGNEAYSGMLGKRGQIGQNSNKMAPKFAALPPPGHDQWTKIPGGGSKAGVDSSVAHIQGVGANFRADKRGVKVCINWKRGMCKFGDRCIYNHGQPGGVRSQLQAAVDSNISPMEKDLVGYRIASEKGGGLIAGSDGKMVWAGEKSSEHFIEPAPEKKRKLGKIYVN